MNAGEAGLWLPAEWPAPPDVRGGTTLRSWSGGRSIAPYGPFNLATHVGDAPEAVAANRRALASALDLPAEPRWLVQVHGTAVADLDAPGASGAPADAAFSGQPGCIPVVLTADCLPVLFCSEDGRWVAAAHAGWRGLAAGVLEACVRAWAGEPARLLAWLGPAIGPEAFEVDAPVREAFCKASDSAESAFRPNRAGHWLCDLYLLARQRLARAGVERVFGGGLCTMADPTRFHSYRRDGADSGRMATLVWREGL